MSKDIENAEYFQNQVRELGIEARLASSGPLETLRGIQEDLSAARRDLDDAVNALPAADRARFR